MPSADRAQEQRCSQCGSALLPAMARCRECGTVVSRQPTGHAGTPQLSEHPPATESGSPEQSWSADDLDSMLAAAESIGEPASTADQQTANETLPPGNTDTAAGVEPPPTDPGKPATQRIGLVCGCGQKLKVKASLLGKRVACPKCGQPIKVALPTEPASDSASGLSHSAPALTVAGESEGSRSTKAEQGSMTTPAPVASDRLADDEEPPLALDDDDDVNDDEPPLKPVVVDLNQITAEIDTALMQPEAASDVKLKATLSQTRYKRLEKSIIDCVTEDAETVTQCRAAILELGRSGDQRAFDLISVQRRSPLTDLREAVAVACGLLPHPESVRMLLEYLADEDPIVRRAAISAIANKTDARFIKPLLALAGQDPSVRMPVVDLLVKNGEDSVDPLRESIQNGKADWISLATMALGKIGGERAIESLVGLAQHPSPDVRCSVADGLARHPDNPAVIKPLQALLKAPETEVRLAAAVALQKVASPKTLTQLMKSCEDPSAEIRSVVVTTLGRIGDPRAYEQVAACCADSSEEVSKSAIEAIGRLGNKNAVEVLLGLLESRPEQTVPILISLKRLDSRSADPRVVAYLENLDAKIRRYAIEAMYHVSDRAVIEKIRSRLRRDRDVEVRAAAARALGTTGQVDVIPDLRNALNDESPVRCQAVLALGDIPHDSVVPILVKALRDAASPVRYHATTALGKLGNPRAIEHLEKLLDDPDAMVQRGASQALEQLGRSKSSQRMLQFRKRFGQILGVLAPGSLIDAARSSKLVLGSIAAVGLLAVIAGAWYLFPSGGVDPALAYAQRGSIRSVGFAANGKQVIAGRTFGMIEFWDIGEQKIVSETQSEMSTGLLTVPGSPSVLFAAGKTVYWWNPGPEPDAAQAKKFDEHMQPVVAMVTSPDGTLAASASANGQIALWDPAARSLKDKFESKTRLTTIALSQGGNLLGIGNTQHFVKLMDLESREIISEFDCERNATAMAFHPSSPILVTGNLAGHLWIWDLAAGTDPVDIDSKSPDRIKMIAFSPDGSRFATGNGSGTVQIWSMETLEPTKVTGINADQIDSLVFDESGDRLVAGGADNSEVWLVDAAKSRVTTILRLPLE